MPFLIFGYSRSGKTTVFKYLTEQGIICADTSQYIDQACAQLTLSLFPHFPHTAEQITSALQEKNDEFFYDLFNLSARNFKVFIAESVIVHLVGRYNGIVKPCLSQFTSPPDVVFTIGGLEADQIRLWYARQNLELTHIVLRSLTEENDSTRALCSNGLIIENNSTKEALYQKLDEIIITPTKQQSNDQPN